MSANKPQPQEITQPLGSDEEEKKVVQKGDQNRSQLGEQSAGGEQE